MIGVKGDLRGAGEFIIKTKIRNTKGEPQHKSEFRLNDNSSVIRELSMWKDKFGVDCFDIKKKDIKTLMAQQNGEMKEEIESLRDHEEKRVKEYREKTKGLREPDKEFQEKMKKAL